MQTIPINMMAYRHDKDTESEDPYKRRKVSTLDRFGYIGFTMVDELHTKYESADRYPRVNADLDALAKTGAEPLPTQKTAVLFGVSSVTGHIPGRMCETFTVGGTANIINTGTSVINQWDEVWVIVDYPNPGDTSDYSGNLGISASDAPGVNRDHLTGFTYSKQSLPPSFDDAPQRLFHLGTALIAAMPGQMCGVLLARPRPRPL